LEVLDQRVVALGGGFLVDLVARRFRPQPGDGTLHLKQPKLGLLKFLLKLGKRGLGDGEFAVPVLKNGVARPEQRKLLLLVLRLAVDLRGEFAQLHLEFTEIFPRGFETILQAGAFDLREIRLVFGGLLLRTKIENGLLRILRALVQARPRRLLLLERRLLCLQFFATLGGGLAQIGQLPFEFGDPTRETAVLECAVRETEVTEAEAEALVAQSLRGLASQASDLPANLGDHVGDSSEVLLRQRKLGHRLPALRLV